MLFVWMIKEHIHAKYFLSSYNHAIYLILTVFSLKECFCWSEFICTKMQKNTMKFSVWFALPAPVHLWIYCTKESQEMTSGSWPEDWPSFSFSVPPYWLEVPPWRKKIWVFRHLLSCFLCPLSLSANWYGWHTQRNFGALGTDFHIQK